MERLSDTQIRAKLRYVMSHHRIDLNKTNFVCTRGVVRVTGDLERQNAYASQPMNGLEVASIEQELGHVRGVVRVHFDVANWQREGLGDWKPRGKRARPEGEKQQQDDEVKSALRDLDAYFGGM